MVGKHFFSFNDHNSVSRIRTVALGIAVLLLVIPVLINLQFFAFGETSFYVSTIGSDSNPGTIDQPFKTFEKARDTVRAQSLKGVRIFVRGGRYNLSSSLAFTALDSGAEGSPNMWLNYPGDEPVVVTGSLPINNLA